MAIILNGTLGELRIQWGWVIHAVTVFDMCRYLYRTDSQSTLLQKIRRGVAFSKYLVFLSFEFGKD